MISVCSDEGFDKIERTNRQLNYIILCILEFVFFKLDQYKQDINNSNKELHFKIVLSNKERMYKLQQIKNLYKQQCADSKLSGIIPALFKDEQQLSYKNFLDCFIGTNCSWIFDIDKIKKRERLIS